MVDTVKFSEFANGGDLSNDKTTVGLDASLTVNTRFNNPWTYLPPGTTGDRPVAAAAMFYRLRLNTTTESYEYYNPTLISWVPITTGSVITLDGTSNQINVDNTDPENPIISLSSTINAPGTFAIQGTTAIAAIINDATLATATATNVSTSAAIKTYVDGLVPSPLPAFGAAGTYIRSTGSAWSVSVPTIADAFAINTIVFASAVSTLTGLAASNSSILGSNATGVPTYIPLTDGQMAIGSAGGTPVAATLTAGANITITNGPGTITIEAATGAGSPLTTKGDLYGFSTLNARIAVGTVNGQMLQVLSSAAAGLAYSTAAYPAVAGTSGNVMTSNGTDWVSSLPAAGGADAAFSFMLMGG